MKFRLLEFNSVRYSRGADAAKVSIVNDDDEHDWLWMSTQDIRKNVMLFGPHLGLLQAANRYNIGVSALVNSWRASGDKAFMMPMEPTRSRDGYWRHPDWPDEESDKVMDGWLNLIGYECKAAWLESDEDAEDVFERYGNGDPDILAWEPKKPDGDGWYLVSIHDHEDGPVAIWLRDKLAAEKNETTAQQG